MRDTQKSAWQSLEPTLPDRRAEVLAYIASRPEGAASFEIAEALHWPINCVSGRVTELFDSGLIRDSSRVVNPHSGKKAIRWTKVRIEEDGQMLIPMQVERRRYGRETAA